MPSEDDETVHVQRWQYVRGLAGERTLTEARFAAEREYLTAQLERVVQMIYDRDMATRLLDETVNRVPTVMDREIGHLRLQLSERVNALKELISEERAAAQRAIDKAEAATAAAIEKQETLFTTTSNALRDVIEENRRRMTVLESKASGEQQQRDETRLGSNLAAVWYGVVTAGAIGIIALISLIIHFH